MDAKKPGVPYSTIRDNIKTFDLLLFRGSDLVSRVILKVEGAVDKTEGLFSHVGVCIRAEDLSSSTDGNTSKLVKPGKPYVFESTMSGTLTDGVKNIEGQSRLGVQLRDLDDVVKAYDQSSPDSRLAWCSLKPEKRPVDVPTCASDCVKKYNGMFYDASVLDLSAVVVPAVRKVRDSSFIKLIRSKCCCCCCCCCTSEPPSKWQVCSELVANIYKDIGTIPSTVEAQNVMPMDFVIDPKSKGKTKTLDSDGDVPVIYDSLVRFYSDL